MDENLARALNEQVKHELASAYFYLSVCGYFESTNLRGCAHWMRVQAQEEVGHAMKFFDFLNDRGERVRLQAIDKPAEAFESPLDAFMQVLENERSVTSLINSLYEQAVKAGDYPTQVLLQWFVQEQVEEERNASDVLERLRLAEDNPTALLLIDRELAGRQPEPAAGG
jgi:ferritin